MTKTTSSNPVKGVRQFELVRPSPEGLLHEGVLIENYECLLCWLEDLPTLKVGTRLTLKETGDKVWTIRGRYHLAREKTSLYQPWKVGGLK